MTDQVYTQTVSVSAEQLESFVKTLNNDVDVDEGEELLTVEEVKQNQELLTYICKNAIEEGIEEVASDPEEFWNMDGWCEWTEYR